MRPAALLTMIPLAAKRFFRLDDAERLGPFGFARLREDVVMDNRRSRPGDLIHGVGAIGRNNGKKTASAATC
jgi:hypothetical protein